MCTSCGAIIALALTVSNKPISECIRLFEELCQRAFTERRLGSVPVVGKLVKGYHHSKYETQPLQDALTRTFGEEEYLFGGLRSDNASVDYKVAVAASSTAGNAVVFSNYNRNCQEKCMAVLQALRLALADLKQCRTHFSVLRSSTARSRSGKRKLSACWRIRAFADSPCRARASSAAPSYFKPFFHEKSKQIYFDGGPYNNNPIYIADRERKLLWPTLKDREPDIVVSVGTAYSDEPKQKRGNKFSRQPQTGIFSYRDNMQKFAKDVVSNCLDGEQAWSRYLDTRNPDEDNKGRYVRLNVRLDSHPPKLDDVGAMEILRLQTRSSFSNNPVIVQAACKLVASSFYFEPCGDVRVSSGMYNVTGRSLVA